MPQLKNPHLQMDTTSELIGHHCQLIWDGLGGGDAAPEYREDRTLRSFSLGEVAEILGVSGSYLRQLSIDGLGPTPTLGTAGRRSYTLRQINQLRGHLASTRQKEALKFCPHRREGEKLQIIAVAAGPARITTSLYLAQGLALQGFRILAVDLDPNGALSEMFGYLPTIYPVHNASMSAVIRYDDDDRVSMRSVIQTTHFDGLDFVPGSFELAEFEEESSRRFRSENLSYPDASIRMVSALKQVERDYDVVVIHCAPEYWFLAAAAYEAATSVLVTIRPQRTELTSTAMFLSHFEHLASMIEKAGRPMQYDFIKYLVTRHNPRDISEQAEVARLRGSLRDHLLTATVWESDAIRETWLKKHSLYELAGGAVGRSAYEQAMETLTSTNAEIMDMLLRVWGRLPMYVSRASRFHGK